MKSILEALVNTLMERFDDAGFNVPKALTEKERESFVFQTLEQAAILPQGDFDALVAAAGAVVNRWESGDLAAAVRSLALALTKECPACGSRNPNNRRRLAGDPLDFSSQDYWCDDDWHNVTSPCTN